jgi:hypothetical protein
MKTKKLGELKGNDDDEDNNSDYFQQLFQDIDNFRQQPSPKQSP